MTTRGIRRKKSYLVDAKIAVCGEKSVGKSGKYVIANVLLTSTWDEKQQTNNRARRLQPYSWKYLYKAFTLNHFPQRKLSLERKENVL